MKALFQQAGLTLVELMVSLAISCLIVIAAASFLLSSSRTRDSQDAAGLLQDNARYATEIITKSIQQAGYQNYMYGSTGAALRREVVAASDGEPDLRGYNNTAAGSDIDHGVHNRSTNRVNNSDTLVARFQGSSSSGVADGSIIDCMGRAQEATSGSYDRAYSIFEVRQSSGSEPELKCKYKNQSTGVFTSEVIVRGVETLQFMYGVDTDGDSFADKWLNAQQVDTANQWTKVKAVRVGMVLRSPERVNVSGSTGTYYPLGINFTQPTSTDPGSSLAISTDDGRLRQVVTFTVNLRNGL